MLSLKLADFIYIYVPKYRQRLFLNLNLESGNSYTLLCFDTIKDLKIERSMLITKEKWKC